MISEAKLISAVINKKDIAPVLNSSNIDMLFTSYGDIWSFVKNYYIKHREVVPKNVLKEEFTDFYPCSEDETSGTIKHYLEQLRNDYTTNTLDRIALGLAKDVGNKSNEDLIKKLHELMSNLTKATSGIKDLDITNHEKSIEHYSEMKRVMEENGGVIGIRSGFDSIDASYPTGFAPGQYIVIISRTNQGKRLRIDEPIPTPDGWSTMGALKPGDKVFGRDGKPCNVVAISEIDPDPNSYRVVFADGAELEADLDHQWVTTTHLERRNRKEPKVRTTKEILATLKHGSRSNHAVPMNAAVELPEKKLAMNPYVLGLWLADGNSRESLLTLNGEDWKHIENELISRGFKYHRVPSQERGKTGSVSVWLERANKTLRALGVLNNKHIPSEYFRASIGQRMDLLRGLMDGDGTVSKGSSELCFTNKQLANDSTELIRSLGIRVSCNESDAVLNGKVVGRRYRMPFVSKACPFSIPRKMKSWKPANEQRRQYRVIKDIVPADPTPMRCITVDSQDHTYIAGRDWIVTHNSWLALDLAINAWAQGKRVLYVSLEMSPQQVRDRAYTLMSRGQFKMSDLSRAQINIDEMETWTTANLRSDESFMICSSDGMGDFSPAQLQSKIEQYGADIAFVDYLQLMVDNRGSTGETEKIRNVSKELKSLSMSSNIPILSVAAASSNDTKEYNKPPEIHETAGSKQAAYDTDLTLALFSHKQHDGSLRTEIVARKNRNGPLFDFLVRLDIEGGTIEEEWDKGLLDDEE